MGKERIIIATIKSWNVKNAEKLRSEASDYIDVRIITEKEDLNCEDLKIFKPSYLFFPHWSWIIPAEIHQNFNCIVFT